MSSILTCNEDCFHCIYADCIMDILPSEREKRRIRSKNYHQKRKERQHILDDTCYQKYKNGKQKEEKTSEPIQMNYGYIRVSTDKQTVENQRFEIMNFAERNHFKINGWIEETISGTKSYDKRELGKLLKKVKKGDLIVCAELSRLGRNLFMIMEILSICMKKECQIWTIKDNYRLGDDIQSKVLAFAFGLSAEIERNLISQRTKEALSRKRAEGVILGRPKGRKSDKVKLSGQEDVIRTLLEHNVPKTEIARIFGVNRMTVYYFIKEHMKEVKEI